MTKTTARHRAPLTPRGRLTRIWSALSALPVGALAGCVAVGAAATTGTPAVGALGLVAIAPATVATVTGWRSRLTDPLHGRRAAGRGASSAAERRATVRLAALLEPATDGPRARSLPPLAAVPRPARPAATTAAHLAPAPAAASAPAPAGRPSPFGPVRARPMLALGTSPAAARTPIVLDVPDLAALQLATGQEALWRGRTAGPAESDPSRLFTVSSASGTVEVVVLTRAERAARDLQVLDALEAVMAEVEQAQRSEPADVVTEITSRARHAHPRREDGGSVASAA